MKCLRCDSDTKNPKFCSRSCAATYNNIINPKRSKEGRCEVCGLTISKSLHYCSENCKKALLTSVEVNSKCLWHLCNSSVTLNGKFCSRKCKNKYYVNSRRKNLKRMAVIYKGGKCKDCNIQSEIFSIYDFHHEDPTKKDFAISSKGSTKSWENIKSELDKCILLCANCHRIRHSKEVEH